jgi:hypothetical protein
MRASSVRVGDADGLIRTVTISPAPNKVFDASARSGFLMARPVLRAAPGDAKRSAARTRVKGRRMRITINAALVFIALTALVRVDCDAVTRQVGDESRSPITVKSDANACELNSLYMDRIRVELAESDQVVIIVARLGTGERSRWLSERRLNTAYAYLGGGPKRVVLAQGKPVNGEGRLEFYVRGRLFLVSLAPREKNICPTCC